MINRSRNLFWQGEYTLSRTVILEDAEGHGEYEGTAEDDAYIEAEFSPYDPGISYGPPERCYPPEGGELLKLTAEFRDGTVLDGEDAIADRYGRTEANALVAHAFDEAYQHRDLFEPEREWLHPRNR